MSTRFEDRPRTTWDVVQFGITFFSILFTGAGVVATSPAMIAIGSIGAAWGIGYFVLKQQFS
jgi:hypothetical protein